MIYGNMPRDGGNLTLSPEERDDLIKREPAAAKWIRQYMGANEFIWCKPTDKQRAAIEQTAQKILDVRAGYPDATLADLYDELTMPGDLRKAHRANDMAVARAYGFEAILDDEAAIVGELFKLYAAATSVVLDDAD